MRVLSKEEFENQKDVIRTSLIENNPIFIYPTDTIYGIGCNATNKEAIEKIRDIKQRKENPFSVIAPSKEWIDENCIINENAKDWIKRLPGPYTLVLKIKNKCVAENITPNLDTLGIRIPDHWFSNFVSEIGIPIVSTSVNKSGNDPMTSLDDLDSEIKSRVDFIVYEDEKKGSPSKIIDLTDEVKVVER
ncbi:threonylcarbamoyl-AMP synthase [Candidatus Woesearchaeota archaeon]|jgi:L-threonylcarbamoyladenylate synthase|nr:threonylcarbamoyl-AMP synthase [Candidatus Woesearchaeota archaeon]|tara:strand:+ start:549 stop:1118 length:570 start_codon:yes stop_codon:yes gene_type:complete